MSGAISIGCAIWGYKPWIGTWLPPDTPANQLLHAYSQRLTGVEVNSTFYALPDHTTIAGWAAATPPNFRFYPKVPRSVSHSGDLARASRDTAAFIDHLAAFGDRLGTAFLQLPPTYAIDQLADLRTWLQRWPTAVPLCVEVRHRSWFSAQGAATLNDLLHDHGVGRVIVDSRPINTGTTRDPIVLEARRKKPNVPLQPSVTADHSLVRFMGHPDLAIDTPLLAEWATRITEWLAAGTTVYVAMHCPVEERTPELCYMFADALVELGVPAPLPEPPQPPQQLSLL